MKRILDGWLVIAAVASIGAGGASAAQHDGGMGGAGGSGDNGSAVGVGSFHVPWKIDDLKVVEYLYPAPVTTVTLQWTAINPAWSPQAYDCRYSRTPIDAGTWASATPLPSEPAPLTTPGLQSWMLRVPLSEGWFYFAMEVQKPDGSWGPLSLNASLDLETAPPGDDVGEPSEGGAPEPAASGSSAERPAACGQASVGGQTGAVALILCAGMTVLAMGRRRMNIAIVAALFQAPLLALAQDAPVTDLRIDGYSMPTHVSTGQVTLVLTTPTPVDEMYGWPSNTYSIRWANETIDDDNWDKPTVVHPVDPQWIPIGLPPSGEPHTFTLQGIPLAQNQPLYFALKSYYSMVGDSQSPLSNCASVVPDVIPPAVVSDLQAEAAGPGVIVLTFTEPGDDGNAPGGVAMSIEIRISASGPIGHGSAAIEDWFATATPLPGVSPLGQGLLRQVTAQGVDPDTSYWAAIRCNDEGLQLGAHLVAGGRDDPALCAGQRGRRRLRTGDARAEPRVLVAAAPAAGARGDATLKNPEGFFYSGNAGPGRTVFSLMDSRPVLPDRGFGPGPIFVLMALLAILGAGAAGLYLVKRQAAERHFAMAEERMMIEREHAAARAAETLRATPAPVTRNPLEDENRLLREKIEKLERELDAAKAPPAKPSPIPTDLAAAFAGLAEGGLASYGKEEFQAFVKRLKEAGKEGVEFLSIRLLTSDSSIDRFLAAALLEGVHDPAAIPALAEAAKKDKDDLTRRMAVHGLAIIGTEAAETPLRDAMLADPDWGVRTNASYGLAKLGRDEGVANLLKDYQASDTPAEYRMAILGGLADVASPSTAPLFRGLLSESKDMGAVLAAIGALAKMKDTGSINDLKRVAETGQPESVRKAAERAIQAIQK